MTRLLPIRVMVCGMAVTLLSACKPSVPELPTDWLAKAEYELARMPADHPHRTVTMMMLLSELGKAGEADRFLKLAELPPFNDAKTRQSWSVMLAPALIEGGRADVARQVVDTWSTTPEYRAMGYWTTCTAAAKQWDFELASELLAEASKGEERLRHKSLETIATEQVKSGRFADAEATIAKLEDSSRELSLAASLTMIKSFPELANAPPSQGPPPPHVRLVPGIANLSLLRALVIDRPDIAEKIAGMLIKDSDAASNWIFIGQYHLQKGDRDAAVKALKMAANTAAEIDPDFAGFVVNYHLLAAQGRGGMTDEVRKTIKAMMPLEGDDPTEQLLESLILDKLRGTIIIDALVRIGDGKTVMETIRKSEDAAARAAMIGTVTLAMTESGQQNAAVEFVESLKDPSERCTGWIGIAIGSRNLARR